ncbi:imidazoleglycerol-phosphate dehydratase HisB [Stomatohabitans albus]|uniref:imidazoleglycerol-phosphate dehydratase HisB n=1 Tax=Stomatohabitans albus TaxID=3110766 RepID=UPI00300C34DB
MARTATIARTTNETDVFVEINLDGTGKVSVDTGVPFFDHMLDQLGRHGRIDLQVRTKGDTHIDAHHTVEDTGIAIGQALFAALGDKRGVERFGDATVPIDEALTRVAIDLSGRPYLVCDLRFPTPAIGNYECSLTQHVFEAIVFNARITMHVAGIGEVRNSHHIHESAWKAVAVALRRAIAVTHDAMPSTKGVL